MPACPSCGAENPVEARFCMSCAAPLAVVEPAREQRKVVTVLFCDLVGSTSLGESHDPEVVRARLARIFEELRTTLERHGGTVEKFVGDAVMAVFGIPTAHEDDALRAVRAASEMRDAIAAHGLEARIGVNTGEVVVGGERETLVTGDAVNVAARLEQAAGSGEILIGSRTRVLVRDAVSVEPVEPLVLKGKSEPVEAHRLLDVASDAAPLARHLETKLVGRERERQRLWRAYEDAVADRSCQLFTLLGPAGIGKSRLVADFLDRVGDGADVLRGRCLSYGEGITYWPLVEILIAIGVEPDSLIGTSPAETQLAFRRLLEARAVERPQVVVIDDLQWGEPVFVDLIEHVADLSRDAPIFLLCIARTELLDVRPGWGGGKLNATSLLLEPLGAEECEELMERLDARVDDALRERITKASAGNPLYVEEMLAMVREHGGDGEIAVPPTIHALLQARIDSLEGDVRIVAERGAVEGEVFHRGTVTELSPGPVRDGVGAHLATLVRKELIRATASIFPEDEGFRFRHLLIRDAAYESLPKATRAELHERFADWLSTHDFVERDEIVGYHLEQAHRYRQELDPSDPRLGGLSRRSSAHLAEAGRGALDRGDFNAGRSLLSRATNLLPEGDEDRYALAPDLSVALFESGGDGWTVVSEAAHAADPRTRARSLVTMSVWALSGGLDTPFEEREAWRKESRTIFEGIGDEYGLALYWWSVAIEARFGLRMTDAAEAAERALVHAETTGAVGLANELRSTISWGYALGASPVDEAIERIRGLRNDEHGDFASAWPRINHGRLLAMKGEFDRARDLVAGGRRLYLEAGMLVTAGGISLIESGVEQRAGDIAAREAVLRRGLDVLGTINDRSYYPTVALRLADCLYEQGRHEEVEDLCKRAREKTGAADLVNFVLLDALEGCLLAHRGDLTEAMERALHGVEVANTTEFFEARLVARVYLAEVLVLADRFDEARDRALSALAIAEAKGDVAIGIRLRERFAGLAIEVV